MVFPFDVPVSRYSRPIPIQSLEVYLRAYLENIRIDIDRIRTRRNIFGIGEHIVCHHTNARGRMPVDPESPITLDTAVLNAIVQIQIAVAGR